MISCRTARKENKMQKITDPREVIGFLRKKENRDIFGEGRSITGGWYIHGVYSPCYAVPPWTEYNIILRSYKNYFFKTSDQTTQATRKKIIIRNI